MIPWLSECPYIGNIWELPPPPPHTHTHTFQWKRTKSAKVMWSKGDKRRRFTGTTLFSNKVYNFAFSGLKRLENVKLYTLFMREDPENDTLTVRMSLYRKYMGVTPPPSPWELHFTTHCTAVWKWNANPTFIISCRISSLVSTWSANSTFPSHSSLTASSWTWGFTCWSPRVTLFVSLFMRMAWHVLPLSNIKSQTITTWWEWIYNNIWMFCSPPLFLLRSSAVDEIHWLKKWWS